MNGYKRLVALAAGGTAGHVFPAVALGKELKARGHLVALVTDERGGAIRGVEDLDVHLIRAGGLAGKSVFRRVIGVLELGFGTLQARGLLRRLRPDCVVGFGGYASVPTMMAASYGGYRTAIHEQNAVLGRANRLLAGRADRIALSFSKSRALPTGADAKTVHTGMPVRPEIAALNEGVADHDHSAAICVMVIGGSQGATVLSEIVPAAVEALPVEARARLQIVQQCRAEDIERVRSVYASINVKAELATFFEDMPARLAAADLMISRSGASSVAEILAAGRPSILVPYPHAIDDHQSANAHAVAEVGAGWLMDQSIFTPERVADRLASLLDNPTLLDAAATAAKKAGRGDAAIRLADMVESILPGDNISNQVDKDTSQ